MNLGLALMQQGRFSEAEKELLEALQLRRSPSMLLNIGALYYVQERFQEAVQYFEASIAEGPATAIRYMDLGDGYRQLGRKQQALEAYRSGRKIVEEDVTRNPRKADARVHLGLISAELGDHSRAEFELAQALALEPENAMVMREAARAYEAMGQREKALDALSRAPSYTIQELARHPDVKALREDPRFQAMLQKTLIH